MRAKVLNILLIIVLIALDFYYVKKAADFSRIYPFNRVFRENNFVYKVDFSRDVIPGDSVIVKIEDDAVDSGNFIPVLKKYGGKKDLRVSYKSGEREETRVFVKDNINRGYFSYLLLILLFANVYYIWGLFINLINPYQYQGRIYFFCTIVISILYFQLCELFVFRDYILLFLISGLILGYFIILLGFNISNQKVPGKIKISIFAFSGLYLLFYLNQMMKGSNNILPLIFLLFYLILCMAFSAGKIVLKSREMEKGFIVKRNYIFVLSIIISYIIPCTAIVISLYTGADLPVPYLLSFTLLTPLLVGNGIVQSTYYGLLHFRSETRPIIFINSAVVLAGTVLLASLFFTGGLFFYKMIHFYIVLIFLFFMFHAIYLLNRKYLAVGFKLKAEFAYSLQNIAELASSPEDLYYKLKNIFPEIMKLTKISDLKLVLFKNLVVDEFYINLDEYIEILPFNSDLAKFLYINKKPFIKYQLMETSTLREDVVKFLDKRDVTLVMPVFKGKELLLALLIGEKEGSRSDMLFFNHEIQYFIAVAGQLNQIIENDRLYRDYVTQKRYEKELDNASYVQLRLFPKVVPNRQRGLDINFYYRPYLRIIGDYFDFINIDDYRTAVIIGDVSGHGLSASMILSAINSVTYSMLREGMTLEKTFAEINFFLNNTFKGIELLTLFIGIFDRSSKEMEYINAGHIFPILIRREKKEVSFIENRGKILGADSDMIYSSSAIKLDSGDELILYTDGIVEIFDECRGERLDDERLMKIIKDNINENVDGKINAVEKDINYFNDSIKDDITIIGVEIR
ncbi:MAG: serine/threonine-protein phosphatase [Spirochaetes bacterium]|nr:serine/threonine-protein phosphatase [Spirochaetota bacterium]